MADVEKGQAGKAPESEDAPLLGSESSLLGVTATGVRLGFIRKVYGIVLAQLLLTSVIASVMMFVEPVRDYVRQSPGMYFLSFAMAMLAVLILAFSYISICPCYGLYKIYPANYVLLTIFTLAESYAVGVICCYHSPPAVVLALVVTAGIVIALTTYAMTTKTDFTAYTGIMLCVLVAFTFAALLMLILPYSRIVEVIYATIGALIMSIYLVIDTQMLVGKFGSKFGEDDYILAALNIYLDIITLFIYILTIMEGR